MPSKTRLRREPDRDFHRPTGHAIPEGYAPSGIPTTGVCLRYGGAPRPMLTDDELFAEIARRRSKNEDFKKPLGELVFRWKDPAATVVRRVQRAFVRSSP